MKSGAELDTNLSAAIAPLGVDRGRLTRLRVRSGIVERKAVRHPEIPQTISPRFAPVRPFVPDRVDFKFLIHDTMAPDRSYDPSTRLPSADHLNTALALYRMYLAAP